MTLDIGFDISGRRARRPEIFDKFPGANWAADFEASAYFASGMLRGLGETIADARTSPIILPDAAGLLQTIASGQPARTSKGLGVYQAATNLVTTSEDLSSFGSGNLTRTIGHPAPDGSSTATCYQVVTGGTPTICAKNGHAFSSSVAVVSWHVKRHNVDDVQAHGFGLYDTTLGTNRGFIRVNFASGVTTVASGTVTTHGSEPLANGWWRIWMVLPVVAGNSNNLYNGAIGNSSMSPGEGWHVWGIQAEIDRLTPYMKTTGTAANRAACLPLAVQGPGSTPFPGYDPAQPDLTFVCEWQGVPALAGSIRALVSLRLNAASITDRALLHLDSSNRLRLGVADAVGWKDGPSFLPGAYDDGLRHRATCYLNRDTGDIKLSVDGSVPVTANKVGQMPSGFTSMTLGHGHGSNHADGIVKSVAAASGDFFDVWRAVI